MRLYELNQKEFDEAKADDMMTSYRDYKDDSKTRGDIKKWKKKLADLQSKPSTPRTEKLIRDYKNKLVKAGAIIQDVTPEDVEAYLANIRKQLEGGNVTPEMWTQIEAKAKSAIEKIRTSKLQKGPGEGRHVSLPIQMVGGDKNYNKDENRQKQLASQKARKQDLENKKDKTPKDVDDLEKINKRIADAEGEPARKGPIRLLDLVDVKLYDPDDEEKKKTYNKRQKHFHQLPNTIKAKTSTNFGDRSWNELLKHNEGKNLLDITWGDEFKKMAKQTGIYVWMHDEFGIFYIGIASPNALDNRWTSHTKKLLGRLSMGNNPKKTGEAYAPVNWINFSKAFLQKGVSGRAAKVPDEDIQKDLDRVRVVWYPVKYVEPPEGVTDDDWKEVWKHALTRIEANLVKIANPRMNDDSDDKKKSVTRNYDPYTDYEQPTEGT